MTSTPQNLKRAQITDALHDFAPTAKSTPPGGGWVRAIRESLGMTQAQLAARLSLTRQSVQAFETAEAERRITLESLDRLAAAMGCRVVMAVVPIEGSIAALRTQRARAQAEKMLGPVSHSMAMESQAVSSTVRERQIEALMEELLAGSARQLWK